MIAAQIPLALAAMLPVLLLAIVGTLGMMHWLRTGMTGLGKTQAERTYLLQIIRQRQMPVVVISAKKDLPHQLLMDMAMMGQLDRVFFDDFDDVTMTPGYCWLRRAADSDLWQLRNNNERFRDLFVSQIMFHRGLFDAAKSAYYEAGLRWAAELFQYQTADSIAQEWWQGEAFDFFTSDKCRYMFAHLRNDRVRREGLDWAFMPPMQRRAETGPAERLLKVPCDATSFIARCGTTVDVREMIDRNMVQIYCGRRAIALLMLSWIVQDVIDHCRSGARFPCLLSMDEVKHFADKHVALAMTEARGQGKGLSIDLLIQNPLDFASKDIFHDIWGNTAHMHFRQADPEAAKLCAEDIGTCLLSSKAVWYTEKRFRQEVAGVDQHTVVLKGESRDDHDNKRKDEREAIVSQTRRRTVADDVVHGKPYDMQIKEIQQQAMQLEPGWMFFRGDRVSPKPVYCPMERVPWSSCGSGFFQKKLDEVLALIRSRPCFRKPQLVLPPAMPMIPELAAWLEGKRKGKTARSTPPKQSAADRLLDGETEQS